MELGSSNVRKGEGNIIGRAPHSRGLLRFLIVAEVKWQKGDIADLQDKVISLRFTLHKARFYLYCLE